MDQIQGSGNGRLVEGVSNEVLSAFFLLILAAAPVIYFLWKNRESAVQVIHPAQQRLVEEVRRQLENLAGRATANGSATGQDHHAPNGRFEPTETPPPLYNRDRNCPICYAQARFAVQTNCGHLFCGACIIAYWRYGNWLGKVNCPVCRGPVSILLPCFTEADPSEPGRAEISRDVNDYNRRFSGEPRSIIDYIRDIPVLVPHLLRELFSFGGLMFMFRLRIMVLLFGAVFYVLSPLDIIPEAAFGILGFFDDFFIIFLLSIYAMHAYREFWANRGD